MSESAEAGEIVTHQEITTESEDEDSDSSTDFDPGEIEKEIMGVKSMLRRHCGRHKVRRRRIEHFHSRGLQLCELIGTKWRKCFFVCFEIDLWYGLVVSCSAIGQFSVRDYCTDQVFIIKGCYVFVSQLFLFIPLFLFTGIKPHNCPQSRVFRFLWCSYDQRTLFLSGKGHVPGTLTITQVG